MCHVLRMDTEGAAMMMDNSTEPFWVVCQTQQNVTERTTLSAAQVDMASTLVRTWRIFLIFQDKQCENIIQRFNLM